MSRNPGHPGLPFLLSMGHALLRCQSVGHHIVRRIAASSMSTALSVLGAVTAIAECRPLAGGALAASSYVSSEILGFSTVQMGKTAICHISAGTSHGEAALCNFDLRRTFLIASRSPSAFNVLARSIFRLNCACSS